MAMGSAGVQIDDSALSLLGSHLAIQNEALFSPIPALF